jgi:hypothetical protein
MVSSMSQPRRKTASRARNDDIFASKPRKVVPHEFVLDAISPLSPVTRALFGCLAIYVENKIVLVLRASVRRYWNNAKSIASPMAL